MCIAKSILLLELVLFQLSFSMTSYPMVDVVQALGWKTFDLVGTDINLSVKLLKQTELNFMINPEIKITKNTCTSNSQFPVIIVVRSAQNLTNHLHCALTRRPYISLLIFDNLQLLTSSKDYLRANAQVMNAFYLSVMDQTMSLTLTDLKLVFTSSRQNMIADNPVQLHNGLISVDYNLNGMKTKAITLPHYPWTVQSECNNQGFCQHCEGIVFNFLVATGRKFNFTVTCHTETSGDWGAIPKSGNWYDPNATFGGILGKVINADMDFASSAWNNNHQRFEWLDFPLSLTIQQYVIAFNIAISPVDPTILFRTFTPESWFTILGFMALIGLCCLFHLYLDSKDLHFDNSWKLSSTVFWFFFVLINIWYGGGLTMYFVAPPSIPFNTLREGLQRYPQWKLQSIGYDDVLLQVHVATDSLYARHWENMQLYPDDHVAKNTADGLQRLNVPGNFFFSLKTDLITTVLSDPSLVEGMNLKTVPVETAVTGPPMTKFSPLKRLLDLSVLSSREYGVIDSQINTYIGDFPKSEDPETLVLNFGQMIVPFGFLGLCIIVSACLLLGEKCKIFKKPLHTLPSGSNKDEKSLMY